MRSWRAGCKMFSVVKTLKKASYKCSQQTISCSTEQQGNKRHPVHWNLELSALIKCLPASVVVSVPQPCVRQHPITLSMADQPLDSPIRNTQPWDIERCLFLNKLCYMLFTQGCFYPWAPARTSKQPPNLLHHSGFNYVFFSFDYSFNYMLFENKNFSPTDQEHL